MLKSLFIVASGLLVLSTALVLVPREVSGTSLSLCTDRVAAVVPGSALQIKTPNFDNGNYADNTRCNLRLYTSSEPVHLYVTFQTIDLENHGSCAWDALCLNGILFCGNWATGHSYQYIVPANNYFTLDFKSDGSVTGRGISLTITATAYGNEAVNIASSGYGSSSTSLGYSTYSLSNLAYTDTCGTNANRATTSYPYYTTVYDYSTTPGYYDSTTYNPWYYQTTNDYYYSTTYNPWDYQTTDNYYYFTTNNQWDYQTTNDYYYSTTYNPWYYQTTNDYYYSTTYNPWYYQTTDNYYYTTTYNPWYYQTTDNYYYTTTYYPYSSWNYETTTYNPWYYQTTNYYQYNTDYYYTSTYYPYSSSSPYYYTSTYNPCQNGYYYTNGYCQYYTSTPSSMNDYIANELRRALQEISSERSSQDQLYSILANLLQNLGHK